MLFRSLSFNVKHFLITCIEYVPFARFCALKFFLCVFRCCARRKAVHGSTKQRARTTRRKQQGDSSVALRPVVARNGKKRGGFKTRREDVTGAIRKKKCTIDRNTQQKHNKKQTSETHTRQQGRARGAERQTRKGQNDGRETCREQKAGWEAVNETCV